MKINRAEKWRRARRSAYEKNFSAAALCIAGLLAAVAFLLNPSTAFRAAQFLLFWFFAWLSGRKNNPLITIIIILGIVVFNLLVPYGRVLFSFGIFKITQGALSAGLRRAITLEGLIMLSRACVRRDLEIPGRFGEILSESFRIFARIMDSRQRISRKNFIHDIDALMIELSSGDEIPIKMEEPQKIQRKYFFILAFAVALTWLPGILGWIL